MLESNARSGDGKSVTNYAVGPKHLQLNCKARPVESSSTARVFSWTQKETQLRYSLSDYSLFSLRLTGYVYSVPLAPLLPATFKSDLEEFLSSAPPEVPALWVKNLPVAKPASKIKSTNGRLRYTLNQCWQYYADLRGNFDNYLASLSGKTRSTVKRKVRKFAGLHRDIIDWRVYKRVDEMSEYHTLARQVAVKTYQERLFNGALPASARFKAGLLELAATDQVRGYLLFSSGSPVAYLHLPVRDGVVQYAYLGYDPAYAAVSPGSVLLYLAIADLMAEERFSYFDFSYGAGQTKEVFSTAKYLRSDVLYLTPSIKHYLAIYGHSGLDLLSATLGRASERLNFRSTIKRALREN